VAGCDAVRPLPLDDRNCVGRLISCRHAAGVFTDENGLPLGDVTVELTDSLGNVFHATTSADGSYRIEGTDDAGLATGIASIRACTSDGREVVKNVVVAGAMTVANLADVNAAVAAVARHRRDDAPTQLAVTGRSTRGPPPRSAGEHRSRPVRGRSTTTAT
jgi:hypothetical protein